MINRYFFQGFFDELMKIAATLPQFGPAVGYIASPIPPKGPRIINAPAKAIEAVSKPVGKIIRSKATEVTTPRSTAIKAKLNISAQPQHRPEVHKPKMPKVR